VIKISLLFALGATALTARASEVPIKIPVLVSPHWVMEKPTALVNLCQQCCVYDSRYYSEGTIIAVDEGLHLHCIRDKRVSGTHTFIWQTRINERSQQVP